MKTLYSSLLIILLLLQFGYAQKNISICSYLNANALDFAGTAKQQGLIYAQTKADIMVLGMGLRNANTYLNQLKSTSDGLYDNYTYSRTPILDIKYNQLFERYDTTYYYLSQIFFDSTKVIVDTVSFAFKSKSGALKVRFSVLDNNNTVIDKVNIICLRESTVGSLEFDENLKDTIIRFINPNEKNILITRLQEPLYSFWGPNGEFSSGRDTLGDTLISSQHPTYLRVRDSLGTQFIDPVGTTWDNVNPDYIPFYDCSIASYAFPNCNNSKNTHNFAYHSSLFLHNDMLKNNTVPNSYRIIGNDSNKKRFMRGLSVVEDSTGDTFEQQEFLWALMCRNMVLPIIREFTFGETSSLNEHEQEKPILSVFPNPASDNITIRTLPFTTVRIYDILGRTVVEGMSNNTGEWKSTSLPYSGYYSVEIESSNGTKYYSSVLVQKQ